MIFQQWGELPETCVAHVFGEHSTQTFGRYSVPYVSPERVAFLDKLRKSLDPAQIAPMAVFLASDAAKDVSGQIFTVIGNEVFLMSQIRPLRSIHRDSGWTPETLAERVLPAFKTWLTPMERTMDVFCWDPI